jgi:peptide/nickel transport system substrate-binding protein
MFILRDGVRWHDGQKLTADDVVFTFDYVRQHPWPWMKPGVVKEATAVDRRTVKVGLAEPYAPFLTSIAGTLPILPAHIWTDVQDPEQFRGDEALVGSGPYRLLDYSPAHGTYLYGAWDGYYPGKPAVERIRFVKYSEEMTPTALQTGEVNAGGVPPEAVAGLKAAGLHIETQPPEWAAKLMINHRRPPLSDKSLRQALAYAIDRKRLVQIVCRGHGIPGSTGLIPSTNAFWHNPQAEQYEHDPGKAQQLLRELGYAQREDGFYQKDGQRLEFELLVSPGRQDFGRLAEVLKRQLAEAGISVRTRGVEAKTLDAMVEGWRFDLALTGHGGLGGDPEILNTVITRGGFNSARYDANAELLELLDRQLRQMDPEQRRRTAWEAQRVYAEELPAITLYHPTAYWAHDGTVELGYTPGGLALGIPIPLNKLSFLRGARE